MSFLSFALSLFESTTGEDILPSAAAKTSSKTAVVPEYEELFIHGADLKTVFTLYIFSLNWPILQISDDIIFFLIFCAVQLAAENHWPASWVGQPSDYV